MRGVECFELLLGAGLSKLIIIGASGHGKVVADIAVKNGYSDIAFLDDAEGLEECAGFPVIGEAAVANEIDGADFVVAIGNAGIRQRIQESLVGNVVTLIHPNASISRSVEIGAGSVVMAGAVINSDAVVGRGSIVNTGASVDHDCRIGDFVHVSVGCHVAGAVSVGDRTWLGIGSTVSNNLNICEDCVVGAGSVVIRDICVPGTYVGIPAKLLRASDKRVSGGGVPLVTRPCISLAA